MTRGNSHTCHSWSQRPLQALSTGGEERGSGRKTQCPPCLQRKGPARGRTAGCCSSQCPARASPPRGENDDVRRFAFDYFLIEK